VGAITSAEAVSFVGVDTAVTEKLHPKTRKINKTNGIYFFILPSLIMKIFIVIT
jgi:hypothetical protein